MKDRIRLLRETKGLTRAACGQCIGVSGDVINNLERGRVEIKDHIIKLLCEVFSVSEKWLRTGEGEMFIELSRDDQIMQWATDILKDRNYSFKKRFVTALSSLGEQEWEMLEKFALKLTEEISTTDTKDQDDEDFDIPSEEDLQKYVVDIDEIDENDPELHPDIRKHVIQEKRIRKLQKKEIG